MKSDQLISDSRRTGAASKLALVVGLLVSALVSHPRAGIADGEVAIDPRLELLRPLVGKTWSGTLRSPDGRHTSTSIREFQLLDGGHVVRATKVNDELHSRGEGFFYWDGERRQVGFFFIENSGVFLTGKATGDGRVITLEGTMTWPEPPPRPDITQSYEFRNTFELISEGTLRDSWFQNAFGPWQPGHVIDYEARLETQKSERE